MKKIRRLLIVSLTVLALLVPMATPVFAIPQGVLDELERLQNENADLRQQIEDLRTNTQVREPLVHIVTPQNIVVEPGEVLEIAVTVRNIGSAAAQGFLSTATVAGDAPFVVEFLNNSNRINSLNNGSQRDMIMRITVDASAAPGDTGVINFIHRYNQANGAPESSEDRINVRVAGEAGTTNVRLGNFQMSTSAIGPDQTFTVTADVQNLGTVAASDVQIAVDNLSSSTIFLTSDINNNFITTLEPGQTRQVSFTFRTARDIGSRTHELEFRLIYRGVSADRDLIPLFVTVLADYATTSPNLVIRSLSVPTARLSMGQTGRIAFELVNNGDAEAHDIRIEVEPTNGLVPTTSNVQTLRTLGPGESHSFDFGFMPAPGAGSHSHPIRIDVDYAIRGAGGTPSPFAQYVALNVYNPEDDDDDEPGRTQTPRIIVSSFAPYPQIPRAGQNFDMEITFLNTSASRSVNNVMIVLEAQAAALPGGQVGSAVFTPVGGSNTLFVPFLAPGEAVTQTVTMFTLPDAAPRMYTLQVNLDYQDQDYNNHDAVQLLSIPVAQFSRLETEPPELQIMPFMDMFGFVDFDFRILNTGRVDLRNVRVRVDGNFDTSESNQYMGNLAIGRTNTFRGRIRPLEPGFQEGAIVVYAEDEAGEIVYISHPIAIEVGGGGDFGDGFGGEFGGDFGDGRWPEGEDGWLEGGADRFPDFGPDGGMWGEDFNGEGEGGIFSRIWAFMRRPVFWGPAAGVIVAAGVAVGIVINRKRSSLDFDDDDMRI